MDSIPAGLAGVVPASCLSFPANQGGDWPARTEPLHLELRRWTGKQFSPFSFQSTIVDSMLAEGSGHGLLCLPTGAGKTATAAFLALRALERSRNEAPLVVWIAPQRELLVQAAAAFERVWWSGAGPHSLDVRIIARHGEQMNTRRPQVLVLTPIMAGKVVQDSGVAARVEQVFFDEAHHASASVFGGVWRTFAAMSNVKFALGLSATPSRDVEGELTALRGGFFDTLIQSRELGDRPRDRLVELGVLSSIQVESIAGIPEYLQAGVGSGGAAARSLVESPERWKACLDAALEFQGRLIVYTPNRLLGTLFARHLMQEGSTSEFIDGEDSLATRISALERFRDGVTRVLVSVQLLLEGIDCPAADGALITYPIASRNRVAQIIGRISRGPATGGSVSARLLCADRTLAAFAEHAALPFDYSAGWGRVQRL